mgnify:CR=1 FL=1
MDFSKIIIFINTVRYLRVKQIYYRIYYLLKNIFFDTRKKSYRYSSFKQIFWENGIDSSETYKHQERTFKFLNISHSFSNEIDWNINKYGKLWNYNLNYFDFINQKKLSKTDGLILIQDFLKNKDVLTSGNDPYPTSLRCINWVKFLSKNKINITRIQQTLFDDFTYLSNNLEYHLLANHLLENAFSLFFGSYYFQNEKFYQKSKKLLKNQLEEQILKDDILVAFVRPENAE